jgi:hypothetical protein
MNNEKLLRAFDFHTFKKKNEILPKNWNEELIKLQSAENYVIDISVLKVLNKFKKPFLTPNSFLNVYCVPEYGLAFSSYEAQILVMLF